MDISSSLTHTYTILCFILTITEKMRFTLSLLLLLLLLLLGGCSGFAPRNAELNAHRDRVLSLQISKKGPGETNKEPLSTSTSSRIEVAKMIVSAAILYMTVQLNVEKAVAKWLPDGLGVDNIIDAADGVKFEDIYIGDGDVLRAGNTFTADCKLFYNGLPIDIPIGDISSASMETYGSSENNRGNSILSTTFSVTDTNEKHLGIMKGMEGLRVGGRRKIVVPPALAFGNRGLPPYIPPNANVLYDLKLLSVKVV